MSLGVAAQRITVFRASAIDRHLHTTVGGWGRTSAVASCQDPTKQLLQLLQALRFPKPACRFHLSPPLRQSNAQASAPPAHAPGRSSAPNARDDGGFGPIDLKVKGRVLVNRACLLHRLQSGFRVGEALQGHRVCQMFCVRGKSLWASCPQILWQTGSMRASNLGSASSISSISC